MCINETSPQDTGFRADFEAGRITPAEFDHIAHLRLAYVYLVEGDVDQAELRMRRALLSFLSANHVPASKFHQTLTRAWLLAVRHFMNRRSSASFEEFTLNGRQLLDSKIMLTHYSTETLFSESARAAFVQPDLQAIPA